DSKHPVQGFQEHPLANLAPLFRPSPSCRAHRVRAAKDECLLENRFLARPRIPAGGIPIAHLPANLVSLPPHPGSERRTVPVSRNSSGGGLMRVITAVGLGLSFLLAGSYLSAEDKDLPGDLMKASAIIGKDVVNPQGESLGKVENFVIDADTGRIDY